MMNKLIVGRFLPKDSFVHRMDARAKVLLSIAYIFIIFEATNWLGYLIMGLFTIAVTSLTKVSLKTYIQGIKPLIWLITFTVFIQMFFAPSGHVLWNYWIFKVTDIGLLNAVYVLVRFILIIMMSTVLTLTTSPLAIADALEYLMKPLLKIKFPVYEVSLMLSIALRFVPTLMDETERIMNAQRARGVDFANGGIIKRVKALVPILIPLFTNAMKRAIELGDAMEARGYQIDKPRSRYRILVWHRRDTMACLVFGLLLIILIIIKHFI
ncbi:energy-coupling factor transporter transmembrane component T family protein [Periweissella beninensis]|uniref:energy-coupling factor transporter transmembrane component T family protein n=1 Tax=Periweissella beninensis TaxID=504936 RepID=UPI0021A5E29C|nr:energy-coupling factor transporter transmembrane component T [Periweissella beninensis]MCT4395944.1 energy-coupling factor transporter transmembrane protein EcfT [Periweissella beninensis]